MNRLLAVVASSFCACSIQGPNSLPAPLQAGKGLVIDGGVVSIDPAQVVVGPAGSTGPIGAAGPAGATGPVGPTGAMGAVGPAGSPDDPATVLSKLDLATSDGGTLDIGPLQYPNELYNLRWLTLHAAAGAACAGLSGSTNGPNTNAVIPLGASGTCSPICAARAGASSCKATVAIGSPRPTQAIDHTTPVITQYVYTCSQAGTPSSDEASATTASTGTFYYCCCY